MKYGIKFYLIFTLAIHAGFAYGQNPDFLPAGIPDSGDAIIRHEILQLESMKVISGDPIHPDQINRKQFYFNLGYILPAWGIDESSGRLNTSGGASVRIGFIGRKQIGGHISFTRQIYKLQHDTTAFLPQQYKLDHLYSNVTGIELGGDFLFIRTPHTKLGMSIGIASSFGSTRYLSISNGGLNGGIFFTSKHFNFLFSMQKLRGEAFIYVDKGNGYYDSVYNVYSLINYTFGVGFTF